MRTATRLALMVLVALIMLSAACARDSRNPSSDAGQGEGHQVAEARTESIGRERTVKRSDRQVLTGIITGKGRGAILVEEDPDADCRGSGPLGPDCGKAYFDITGKTGVFREKGDGNREAVSPGALEKGQRVRADYTGFDSAMSYPMQSKAREVTILKPS